MAVIFSQSFLPCLSPNSLLSQKLYKPRKLTISANSKTPYDMDLHNKGLSNLLSFPYVSVSHRNIMVDLISTVEDRLGSLLLPCTLPHDVQSYQSSTGTAHASLHIRSGQASSPIDFMLGSWLHSELPGGGELNITSFSMYLNSSTDAPNFSMDLIRGSPKSATLFLDLSPRKDLVLNPDYLKTFYEDTGLKSQRKLLEKLPEVSPYCSPSLYSQAVVSPTGILATIKSESAERIEEIMRDHVGPVSKEVLRIWLDHCYCGERVVGELEKDCLRLRDKIVKTKTVKIDLATALPRLFGQETADRVMAALGEYF